MIDTITLCLNTKNPKTPVVFSEEHFNEWSPNIRTIINGKIPFGGGKFYSCYYNPSNLTKRTGLYYPKLKYLAAVRYGGVQHLLYITFSAPKLVFGNNFNELTTKDSLLVISILSKRLAEMGIKVSRKSLLEATVSELHYSKNFLLFGGSPTATEILEHIKLASVPRNKTLDIKYHSYGGETVSIYTKTAGLCFYDKKAENKNSKNINTGSIFLDASDLPNTFSVLRMEARYFKPAAIHGALRRAGVKIPTQLDFKSLFMTSISKKVLESELGTLEGWIIPTAIPSNNSLALFKDLVSANPSYSPEKLLSMAATQTLVSELGSAVAARSILGLSNSQWSKRKRDFSKLNNTSYKSNNPLLEIKHQLHDFVPLLFLGQPTKKPP